MDRYGNYDDEDVEYEEPDEEDTTVYPDDEGLVGVTPEGYCADITLDDVLGPGATEAQRLRQELVEMGLVKKDTRRPGTRCDEHDEHERENT
jgi:hypothetical protein